MWKIRAIIKNINNVTSHYNDLINKNQIGVEEYLILLEGLKVCAQKINDYITILNEIEADEALEKIYTLITKIEIKIEEFEENFYV